MGNETVFLGNNSGVQYVQNLCGGITESPLQLQSPNVPLWEEYNNWDGDDNSEMVDTFVPCNPVDKYTSDDLPKVFREPVNPSSWTNDPNVLVNAPSPKFMFKGQEMIAKGVVDIKNCKFYIYDSEGKAIEAFNVANGAPSSPTKPSVRKVLSKMEYPYSNCPKSSKRYRYPRDYGPKIAYLNIVNTKTGTLSDNGEYLHGTRSDKVLQRKNRHLTHGCTRLFNRDALYVINDVLKVGDYLKFVE